MTTYWEWDVNPDVINKKCSQCGVALRFDRTSAVLYKDKSYHSYCLLEFLAAYHTNHVSGNTGSDCGEWGLIP
jgi:hypothetical protein